MQLFRLLTLLVLVPVVAAQGNSRIDDLLAKMTVAEKAAQMTQLDLSMLTKVKGAPGVQHELDPEKIRQVVTERAVGSILNACEIAHTPEHWHEIIGAIQDAAAKSRLGVPVVYGVDSIHGANYVRGSVLFPQQLNLASSFDDEAARAIARVTAKDTRAVGLPWNFAPVVDVARSPVWSRFWETFGQDVLLSRRMGVAMIEAMQEGGLQSDLAVAACLKHFLGYSAPRTGRDRTPAYIPERQLREFFLPPFIDGVKAGAATLMVNSGDISGLPVHADKRLLTDILRGELGFEGVVVTDWQDVQKLIDYHRVAPNDDEATYLAVTAGIDMAMVPLDWRFTDALVRLVEAGRIPESRLDQSVRRILKLKEALGLFEKPKPDPEWIKRIGTDADKALSLRSAIDSVILLKNEAKEEGARPPLPLAKGAKILVTGPGADNVPMWHGSWTWTWQGDNPAAYPADAETFVTAMQRHFGADHVRHAATPLEVNPGDAAFDAMIANAMKHAAAVDVIVVAIGEKPSVEKPGDIGSLGLARGQEHLVEMLSATGKPVVMVTVGGRPLIIKRPLAGCAAHLHAGLPGPMGPEAVSAILIGKENPSARLPFTWPRAENALLFDDHVFTERLDTGFGMNAFQPLYQFGSGLSYTKFSYSDLEILEPESMRESGKLRFSVTVLNEGDRAGAHPVLAFVRDHFASITPSWRRLRDYQRVELDAGVARRLTFEIPIKELGFVGIDNRWVLEPGEFTLMIGELSQTFRL